MMLIIYESVYWQNPFRREGESLSQNTEHICFKLAENIKHASSAELSPALGQNLKLTQPIPHRNIYYETATCGILIEHRGWISVCFYKCIGKTEMIYNWTKPHGTFFSFYLISVLLSHVSQSVICPGHFPRQVKKVWNIYL